MNAPLPQEVYEAKLALAETLRDDEHEAEYDIWVAYVARDCACCGMNFYRTFDGGCTYCDGKQVCCRN